jgi:hypothetical protein
MLSALLEAEHEEFQREPASPHQHAGPREVCPGPPTDEDEGPDQRDGSERDEPGDLAAKCRAEHPPDTCLDAETASTPGPVGEAAEVALDVISAYEIIGRYPAWKQCGARGAVGRVSHPPPPVIARCTGTRR